MIPVEQNRFLNAFGEEARQKLVRMSEPKTVAAGVTLFQENDAADGLYLVLDGEVELIKKTHHGNMEVLARVGAGDYFGEMGVFDNCGRSAGARTAREAVLVKLPAAPVLDILKTEHSDVCLHFLGRVSDHLRATNARYIAEVLRKERLAVIGQMAGSIIHDFKNPMTSIQLASELIDQQCQDAAVTGYCQLIRQQVERMIAMAREILDYSQGRFQLDRTKITVEELFKETERLNIDYLRKKRVSVSFQGIPAEVSVDMQRIVRVLQNLLTNAVEAFGGRVGNIRFESSRPDAAAVELRVIDDGPGIPDQIRSTVFEPFVTSGKRHGTGLGMAIAKSIVEAHGGAITFQTESGKGTTFIVRLPVAPPTPQ